MSNAYQAALRDGIFGYPAYFNPAVDRALNKQTPGPLPGRIELQRIALDTKTTDMVEHSFGLTKQIFFDDDWIELARLPSQFNDLTTLRQIDTEITDWSGQPLYREVTHIFENLFVEYWLVYTELQPRPRRVFSAIYSPGALPGTVAFQLPKWRDNRFRYGLDNELSIPLIPNRNLSLIARINYPSNLNAWPEWTGLGANYVKGDIVQIFGGLFMCVIDHMSSVPKTPPNNFYWISLGSLTAGGFIGVYGKLQGSVQSERNLSAKWQAERTFKT